MNAPVQSAWVDKIRIEDEGLIGVARWPCHSFMPQEWQLKVFTKSGTPVGSDESLPISHHTAAGDPVDPVLVATEHLHTLLASAKDV